MNIKEIDIDLDRCEKVLKENNYMEIVIAIEELQDKYRDKVDDISENENSNVWNYSKKDLEKIEKSLIYYKQGMILKEKQKNIYERVHDLRIYINENDTQYRKNIEETINLVEEVNNKDISLDEKYDQLKRCFDLLKKLDRNISIYLLELINLSIK